MYGSVGASNSAFESQSDNQQTCCFASLLILNNLFDDIYVQYRNPSVTYF